MTISNYLVEKMANIKRRILEIADIKGVSKEKFCKDIGMSYSSFKGESLDSAINSTAIDRIITIFPDIDLGWLFTGKGSMFQSNPPVITERSVEVDAKIELMKDLLKEKEEENIELRKQIWELESHLNGREEGNRSESRSTQGHVRT